MAHTTLNDYIEYAGEGYDASKDARITYYIPIAERDLVRRVGVDFYDASDPTSNASQDWIFVTCALVDYYLLYDDAELRADAAGPYKSKRLGDYAFTLRDDMWTPYRDPRIRDIISDYDTVGSASSLFFITAVGPAPYRRVETTEL